MLRESLVCQLWYTVHVPRKLNIKCFLSLNFYQTNKFFPDTFTWQCVYSRNWTDYSRKGKIASSETFFIIVELFSSPRPKTGSAPPPTPTDTNGNSMWRRHFLSFLPYLSFFCGLHLSFYSSAPPPLILQYVDFAAIRIVKKKSFYCLVQVSTGQFFRWIILIITVFCCDWDIDAFRFI